MLVRSRLYSLVLFVCEDVYSAPRVANGIARWVRCGPAVSIGERRDTGRLERGVVASLVSDVLVDVQVVLPGPGPRVIRPHAVELQLAELLRKGIPKADPRGSAPIRVQGASGS